METIQLSFTVYAFLMIIGGYFGYKKAGSKASLISGSVSGLLVLFGVYLAGINYSIGLGLIAIVTGLLVVAFIIRLKKTKKFMPSGMLLILSIIAFIVSAAQLIN